MSTVSSTGYHMGTRGWHLGHREGCLRCTRAVSGDYTGQSQDPGRDPLAQHLVDVAWVHVAKVASPDGVHAQDVREIDQATRDAVSAVLRELSRQMAPFGLKAWFPDELDALAFEIDSTPRETAT